MRVVVAGKLVQRVVRFREPGTAGSLGCGPAHGIGAWSFPVVFEDLGETGIVRRAL